jgi:hypothetical protein
VSLVSWLWRSCPPWRMWGSLTVKSMLYRWVDKRNSIPFWVRWLFPKAHWCPEMDELLILDNVTDCFCGYVDGAFLLCPLCGDHSRDSECSGGRGR